MRGMKKIRKIFKEIWLNRQDILQALAYIVSMVFYGVVLTLIASSGIGIFLKILLCIVDLILGLVTCIGLYHIFGRDDE